MKYIDYQDQTFRIPDWVNYVAADDDGEVWGYAHLPAFQRTKYDSGDGQSERIGELDRGEKPQPLYPVQGV